MRAGRLADPAGLRPPAGLDAPVAAGRAALGAALLAACAAPLLARGGYLPAGRALFVVLASVALVTAVAVAPESAKELLRSSPVLALAGLAALAVASSAWTITGAEDALRWAALVGGYAATVVAAGVFLRVTGEVRLLAGGLAVLAGLAGMAGILGVATLTEPFADRIDGVWRAGGTLEYPPALGLLEVSALPLLLTEMARRPGSVPARAAALGAAIAAISLVLTGSRLHPFLGACVLLAAVAWPALTIRSTRAVAIAAAALVCASALAAHLLAGGQPWVLVLPPLAALGWPAVARARPLVLVGAAAAALLATLALATPVPRSGDLLHGRDDLWSASLRSAGDRPLQGAGADAFYAASERYQDGAPARFAHNLALELLVELGAAGLILALILYGSCGRVLWLARGSPEGWLLGPAVAAFLIASLLDWPWHMAGPGAVFAAALGGVIAHNH